VEVDDIEIQKRLQSLTETETRCNVFAAVSDVPTGKNQLST